MCVKNRKGKEFNLLYILKKHIPDRENSLNKVPKSDLLSSRTIRLPFIVSAECMRGKIGNDITETMSIQSIYDRSQKIISQILPVDYFVNKVDRNTRHNHLITYFLWLLSCYSNGRVK